MQELLLSAFDVHEISNINHSEMHTSKPVVPESSYFEVEVGY
jgi:hypothetical protein